MGNDSAVIEMMANIEEKLRELYLKFAAKFPEDSAFWHMIAEDERNHANILRSFGELVEDSSSIKWKFRPSNLEKTVICLEELLNREFENPDSAIQLAEELETNIIEKEEMLAHKDEVAGMTQLLGLLDTESRRHVEMISEYKAKKAKKTLKP